MKPRYLSVLFFCCIGFLFCLILQNRGLSGVISSAAVGLLGSFLPKSKYYNQGVASACIYSASFAAIGALTLTDNYLYLLFIPLSLSLVYILFDPYFKGFGGKLGTIAFIAVSTFAFLKVFI